MRAASASWMMAEVFFHNTVIKFAMHKLILYQIGASKISRICTLTVSILDVTIDKHVRIRACPQSQLLRETESRDWAHTALYIQHRGTRGTRSKDAKSTRVELMG